MKIWSEFRCCRLIDDALFQIVAAWFSLFDVVFLIILLPLFDRVIYPYLKKRDMHVGIVCRISVGMMFATIAVLVAGIVELLRLRAVWKFPDEECCSCTINQTIGIINPYLVIRIIWDIIMVFFLMNLLILLIFMHFFG